MARNSVIVVRAPEDAHIRIARRGNTDEATHEVLATWEVGLFVKLLELHVTRALAAKYGEGTYWGWVYQDGWREFLPLTGKAEIIVDLANGDDRRVTIKRIGEMNIAISEEQVFGLR